MFQPSVLIPFLLCVAALAGFFFWYRSKLESMRPDADDRPIAGARLTAERLRNLGTPPWRVVYEVGSNHLGSVDHVVIGPPGVFAIETLATDRPIGDTSISGAQSMANAAITRAEVDALAATVGSECRTLLRVFWGAPRPDLDAGRQVAQGLVDVEGQRLNDWFVALPPGPLTATQVDQVWQAVLTGIGRPDPLG